MNEAPRPAGISLDRDLAKQIMQMSLGEFIARLLDRDDDGAVLEVNISVGCADGTHRVVRIEARVVAGGVHAVED